MASFSDAVGKANREAGGSVSAAGVSIPLKPNTPFVAPLPLTGFRLHPLRPSTVVWAAGRNLFAYDTDKCTWELPRREAHGVLAHGDAIRALDAEVLTTTPETTRWVSAGDDKQVIVWKESGANAGYEWQVEASTTLGKKLTTALLDGAGRVVCADRFGDVWRWCIQQDAEAELLFSHLAIVTGMCFAKGRRFLVTCDNHEKIRVSCYPAAFEIHSFCLGHTSLVSALAVLPFTDSSARLLSAGADCTLRLWSLDGKPLSACELGSVVSGVSVACEEGDSSPVIIACCEVAPFLRRFRLADDGSSLLPETEPKDTVPIWLGDVAPQALCLAGSLGQPFCIDRRGHLRTPPKSLGEVWGDVFQGEDIPAALAGFSKFTNWLDGDGPGKDEDGDDGAAPDKKRKLASGC